MDSAVVPERHTKAIVDLLDPSLVHRIPQLGPSQIDPLDGRCRRAPNPVRGDVCIESPIWGIDARRWLSVTLAAVYKHGPRTFLRAADPKQFRLLESEVASNGKYVNCPTCGGFMTSRGLEAHQANSSLCRFTRAVNEVEDAWAIGFRDPWNTPGAPTTWEALARRPVWRQRVRTVAFPHFHRSLALT